MGWPAARNGSCDPGGRIHSALVFPHHDELPPSGLKAAGGVAVSFDVAFELRSPPRGVAFRQGAVIWTHVPEAAANLNRHAGRTEDYVNPSAGACNHGCLKPVPEASSVKGASEG